MNITRCWTWIVPLGASLAALAEANSNDMVIGLKSGFLTSIVQEMDFGSELRSVVSEADGISNESKAKYNEFAIGASYNISGFELDEKVKFNVRIQPHEKTKTPQVILDVENFRLKLRRVGVSVKVTVLGVPLLDILPIPLEITFPEAYAKIKSLRITADVKLKNSTAIELIVPESSVQLEEVDVDLVPKVNTDYVGVLPTKKLRAKARKAIRKFVVEDLLGSITNDICHALQPTFRKLARKFSSTLAMDFSQFLNTEREVDDGKFLNLKVGITELDFSTKDSSLQFRCTASWEAVRNGSIFTPEKRRNDSQLPPAMGRGDIRIVMATSFLNEFLDVFWYLTPELSTKTFSELKKVPRWLNIFSRTKQPKSLWVGAEVDLPHIHLESSTRLLRVRSRPDAFLYLHYDNQTSRKDLLKVSIDTTAELDGPSYCATSNRINLKLKGLKMSGIALDSEVVKPGISDKVIDWVNKTVDKVMALEDTKQPEEKRLTWFQKAIEFIRQAIAFIRPANIFSCMGRPILKKLHDAVEGGIDNGMDFVNDNLNSMLSKVTVPSTLPIDLPAKTVTARLNYLNFKPVSNAIKVNAGVSVVK